MSFERAVPNPQRLARWLAELDTPIDQHPAMVEAVDWLHYRIFMEEVESDPRVRDEWERFLMNSPGDYVDEDILDDVDDDF